MSTNGWEYEEVSNIIRKYIADNVRKPALIGLSGGIDSSLTCKLTAEALGKERLKLLVMENERYDNEAIERAHKLAQRYGIRAETIRTESARTGLEAVIDADRADRQAMATLDARICDDILRTVAMEENKIYVGTINGTERLTGWYPKSELVGDICPIGGLLKEQVQDLAEYHGLEALRKTVADDASKICSGCGQLDAFEGIPYHVLDNVLYHWETSETTESFWTSIDTHNISQEYAITITERVKNVKHKQSTFPPYPTVNR